MEELKINRVWNSRAQCFTPEDINDAERLATMHATRPLWDADFNEVKIHPKASNVRAHFKLKTGATTPKQSPDDRDPTHDQAISAMVSQLINTAKAPVILTKGWQGKELAPRKLWTPHPSSDYRWYLDPGTRITTSAQQHVRPDIVGVDITRLSRTQQNPAVIVEVVHHHWPDGPSWKKLVELSRCAHLVVFYFVKKEFSRSNFANTLKDVDGAPTMLISAHLDSGIFCWDDCAVGNHLSEDEHYQFIKDLAMRKSNDRFIAQGRAEHSRAT